MRLVVDEDSQRKLLVRLLKDAGHDVLKVNEADLVGQADVSVLAFARTSMRVVLTRNFKDFQALHLADPRHPGILVVQEDHDRTKNMSANQIVLAIANLEASDWNVAEQLVSLNEWNFLNPEPATGS